MADVGKALIALTPVEKAGGGMLRRMLEMAIDGVASVPGAREASARALARRGDHEDAIESIVRLHTGMAGAQGFVTNLGGIASAAVAIPANMAGLALLELRLVACIAHLRGYDVDDARVRSAIMMTLLGPDGAEGLPTPLVIATAPVFDPELDRQVSERVMGDLLTAVGGRRAATLIGRRVPVLGGGVGAALDGWNAHWVGRFACEQFVVRRSPR